MKKLKAVFSSSLLALLLLLFSFGNQVQASDQIPVEPFDDQNMVSIGSIANFDIKLYSDSLESLEAGERQRLLCSAIEILVEEYEGDIQNEISTYATSGEKVVDSWHTCYPIGPYLPDTYYEVAFIYDKTTGKILAQIDFYICGHVGKDCEYLAHVYTEF